MVSKAFIILKRIYFPVFFTIKNHNLYFDEDVSYIKYSGFFNLEPKPSLVAFIISVHFSCI